MSNDTRNVGFIKTTLNSLRTAVFGRSGDVNSSLDSIKADIYGNISDISADAKIDRTINKLSAEIISKDAFNYAETMRSVMTQNIDTDFFDKNITLGLLQTPELNMRIGRYQNFDDVCNNIPYCARAVKVLADGITSPDDITKECIQILENSYTTEADKEKISRINAIKDTLELDNEIFNIVHDTLKYGDQFIEICHIQSKEVPITQSMMLSESISIPEKKEWQELNDLPPVIFKTTRKPINYNEKDIQDNLNENYDSDDEDIVKKMDAEFSKENEEYDYPIKLEIVEETTKLNILNEASNGKLLKLKKKRNKKYLHKDEKNDNIDIKDVRIIIHEPRRIIKIQSYKYKMNLGFIVIPDSLLRSGSQGYMSVSGGTPSPAGYSGPLGSMSMNVTSGLDMLYLQILKTIKKYISTADEIDIDKDEMTSILKLAIDDMEKQNLHNLKVRYVPPERMEHFHMNNRFFYPYGESIFQKSLFAAKLLIALETAVTIKRISDSSEKRVIYIDALLPRSARTTIETVKEALKKRRIGIDTFGSISSIPSMITSFEDYYLPQRQGHKYVEFDTLQPAVNIRDITEELKFFRDNIVSSLEVPSAFLSVEENLCCVTSTVVRLISGEKVTIEKIISEYENGNDNMYVYTYDQNSGKVVPGKITWAGHTRKNAEIIRVTLDNDKYIECTPDHKFMLRDETYKEAKDLIIGDSLMPLYNRYSKWQHSSGIKYESIYHPGINEWQLTHQVVADRFGKKYGNGYALHHGKDTNDFNPFNNHPDNLISLSIQEHMKIHMSDRHKNKRMGNGALTIKQNCIICGKSFEKPMNLNKVACSKECQKIYRKETGMMSWKVREKDLRKEYPIIKLICSWCGKEYETSVTTKLKKKLETQQYLWNSCDDPICTEKVRQINIPLSRTKGRLYSNIERKICKICSKDFYYTDGKKETKKFIDICYDIACVNTKLARDSAASRRNGQNLTCPICGKVFYRPASYIKVSKDINNITCGEDYCYSEMRKKISQKINMNKKLIVKQNLKTVEENADIPILNHKVVKIEYLEERKDCGDIEVENYHNFAVEAGVFIHNSNKSILAHESSLFAETIIGYQKLFTKHLKGIFSKLYKYIYHEIMPLSVNVTFSPPRNLQIEKESENYEIALRIINSLSAPEVGVPREYLKKKYLAFDWDEIENSKSSETLDKEEKPQVPTTPDMMGGGGMMGPGY